MSSDDEEQYHNKTTDRQKSVSCLSRYVSKKRSDAKSSGTSLTKHRRTDNFSLSVGNESNLNDNQSLSISSSLKDLNNNLIQVCKQIRVLKNTQNEHKRVLNTILIHQKRLVKAMLRQKVKI